MCSSQRSLPATLSSRPAQFSTIHQRGRSAHPRISGCMNSIGLSRSHCSGTCPFCTGCRRRTVCKGLASHHVQLLCRSLGAVNPLPRGRGFVLMSGAHIGFRLAVSFVAMRLLLSIFEPEPPSPLPAPESSSVNSESPSLLSAHLRRLFASASFAASCLELECRGRPRAAAFFAVLVLL